jgi:aspartate carbamoyltransferase catalytic subunit
VDSLEWLRGRDVLTVGGLSRGHIDELFGSARRMRSFVRERGGTDLLRGKVLANLFYEPSTRTSSCFLAAMTRLGGSVIPISEVRYSSVSKGESLRDTVRTLEAYADVIVLRHPEEGAAKIAADAAKKPIINAGDGAGEHPTQALLDLFTIHEELGRIEGLTVTLLGDLKYGRTVHSLARLLALYGVKVRYVSPSVVRMPEALVTELSARGLEQTAHATLDEVISETDVLYVTRVQKERFSSEADYEVARGGYRVDLDVLAKLKKSCAILHPLPRVGEIDEAVDDDPRAAYFRQVENGMYVRMALLAAVLGRPA